MTYAILFVLGLAALVICVLGANPTVTARVTPTGFKMPDGYQTLIAFKINPAIQFWEKEVTPIGWKGGDAIDTTTMLNQVVKTKDAQHLKENTEVAFVAAYDPNNWNGVRELINANNAVTVIFPSGAKVSFWGYLRDAMPQAHKIGEMPTMQGVIVVTNWDPVNFVEVQPLFSASAGTL